MRARRSTALLKRSVRIRVGVIAGGTALLILFAVGLAVYFDRVAPLNFPVLRVDGNTVTMGSFLRRAYVAGGDPLSTLQTLTREQVIRIDSAKAPYFITATDAETDRFLRQLATGTSTGISEKEYSEWYRQQLNETRLSKREFLEVGRTALITRKLQAILAADVSQNPLQAHLHMIIVKSDVDAAAASKRLTGGERFDQVAHETSSDPELKSEGGDLGWFPKAALNPVIAELSFDSLRIGEISAPITLDQDKIALVMVSERAPRPMDEDSLGKVKSALLDEWLADHLKLHTATFLGFDHGYDARTDDWVRHRLAEMR